MALPGYRVWLMQIAKNISEMRERKGPAAMETIAWVVTNVNKSSGLAIYFNTKPTLSGNIYLLLVDKCSTTDQE